MPIFPSKSRLAHIVFEHDDKASKNFDLAILILILGSLVVVILDSEPSIYSEYHRELLILEWIFTGLFTIEYGLRIWLSKKKWGYIFSFYGLVDLLAIVPTFLSLFLAGTQFLVVIRALRLLRVVRILKLGRYMKEAEVLKSALKASKLKIQLFLGTVVTIILIAGTLMFIVEGPESGYTSIGMSMYWAIVTLTTVGFGDITPLTPLGKFLASVIMLLGYAIIAVPTGIVTSELAIANTKSKKKQGITCNNCNSKELDLDAAFCKFCGSQLKNVNKG
ncbi:Potassium voltage-gated channel subfamily KQT [Indibacter alkaliphilus LW1]|uniref:Potassium voltage-gated channel subfamily KQT n=1 Tax=Indibacter alkaliphilus (strain CCUG 57479 / KCTC 22604 / LW1) TaxID=1189612 RepID=S2DHH8_INDAL|nr:ion transporter [Indibacter alkaliphilus]EOZ96560.1 Potassium voltage-gated channel subfamily KQT [Indibacter alkaliphilus LW1]